MTIKCPSLTDTYPAHSPEIKLFGVPEPTELERNLHTIADDNLGDPVLYSLIATTQDFISNMQMTVDNIVQEEVPKQTICQFFLLSKCRFGESCRNSHETGKQSQAASQIIDNHKPMES